LTENHEPCACFLQYPLNEFKSISTQSVFVPDHNFLDHSFVYSVQKGLKTFALVVETGANVRENLVPWVGV
jgi:hypothetical protein